MRPITEMDVLGALARQVVGSSPDAMPADVPSTHAERLFAGVSGLRPELVGTCFSLANSYADLECKSLPKYPEPQRYRVRLDASAWKARCPHLPFRAPFVG